MEDKKGATFRKINNNPFHRTLKTNSLTLNFPNPSFIKNPYNFRGSSLTKRIHLWIHFRSQMLKFTNFISKFKRRTNLVIERDGVVTKLSLQLSDECVHDGWLLVTMKQREERDLKFDIGGKQNEKFSLNFWTWNANPNKRRFLQIIIVLDKNNKEIFSP